VWTWLDILGRCGIVSRYSQSVDLARHIVTVWNFVKIFTECGLGSTYCDGVELCQDIHRV
jgi:hypothetical protein